MEINKNLLIAMQVIKDECIKHSKCEDCPVWEHLDDICEPHYWSIPAPPPEPTERPRIEWLIMLPDKEMVSVCAQRCEVCKYESRHGTCEMFDCYDGMSEWWHEVVSLEQFRKDVGLNNETNT